MKPISVPASPGEILFDLVNRLLGRKLSPKPILVPILVRQPVPVRIKGERY